MGTWSPSSCNHFSTGGKHQDIREWVSLFAEKLKPDENILFISFNCRKIHINHYPSISLVLRAGHLRVEDDHSGLTAEAGVLHDEVKYPEINTCYIIPS